MINLSKVDFGGVATGGKSKPEETFDVQPTTTEQTITPTEGSVFSRGTVRAVTSEIDNNIQPENIKEGVSILGVTGTLSEGSGGSANLVPLTVEASNENQIFDPSNYGADGFNSVNANGYDVDALHNTIEDIYVGELGSDPTTLAEWDYGKAYVKGSAYTRSYNMDSPITDLGIGNLESISWSSNTEVSHVNIYNTEYLTTYKSMFRNTSNLTGIEGDLGHKDNIDMSSMFDASGIEYIMNLGLETCKPSNLSYFARNSQIAQLPWMDTSECTNFNAMISKRIKTLPAYSFASLKSSTTFIASNQNPALTTIEGLVDLGKSFTAVKTFKITATYYPLLTKQSAWNIVNTVYDFVANNGAGNGSTLDFAGFNWEWDEGEQNNLITTANAKGWNIAF